METSLSHYLLMPCLICLLSASPLAHTTAHPPLSLLSDEKLQRLIPVPFFPFNKHQGRFIKESTVGGDRSTQFGLPLRISPPALGTEQPGWGSCYTLVQEMPSAKCPPEWCFSKWAKKNILYMAAEVHHSCHKNIRTQPGLEVDPGSGGRLGKWPTSLPYLPMFPFGERDSWLSMARDGSGEQDGTREHWHSLIPGAAHPERC